MNNVHKSFEGNSQPVIEKCLEFMSGYCVLVLTRCISTVGNVMSFQVGMGMGGRSFELFAFIVGVDKNFL